ncbi:hypothetical protein FRB91_006968 [Serendipita sp. 411]|nr:hypothetical protein FRB91_006968 [Serendipita sp. 411]
MHFYQFLCAPVFHANTQPSCSFRDKHDTLLLEFLAIIVVFCMTAATIIGKTSAPALAGTSYDSSFIRESSPSLRSFSPDSFQRFH